GLKFGGNPPLLSSQSWIRLFVPARDISPTDSRSAGLLVAKISCFHSQIQRSAEGIPEEIEAPAPKSKLIDLPRFTATERTSASSSSCDGWEFILKHPYQCIDSILCIVLSLGCSAGD